MSWAGDAVDAVLGTLRGCLDEQVVTCVGAVGGDDAALEYEPGEATGMFEIGSVTKTLTATALADLALMGEVDLSDPIGRWMDAGNHGGLTLEALATHTSGLPRLAPNASQWPGYSVDDPYAGYTAEYLEEGLRATKLETPGAVAYSNFGYQVLALVLERACDATFEKILRERVFDPLGLTEARLTGDDARQLVGHADGRPVPHWHDLVGGPGGVEATGSDMLAYLRAVVSPPEGRVGDAIRLAREPRVAHATGEVGLGWHIHPRGQTWHNGATGGFRSALVTDLGAGRGLVALTNTKDVGSHLDAAAFHLMWGERPPPFR